MERCCRDVLIIKRFGCLLAYEVVTQAKGTKSGHKTSLYLLKYLFMEGGPISSAMAIRSQRCVIHFTFLSVNLLRAVISERLTLPHMQCQSDVMCVTFSQIAF